MLKNISTPNATASMTAPAATTPEVITSVSKQAPSGSISCVFCGGGHLYEKCPSNPTSINHLGYNNNNTLYSNAYNSGWEDHPNFKCSNNFATTIPTPPPEFPSQYVQRPPAPVIDNSMEALLKEFMGKTDASIKNLENQVGQLATALYQRPSGLLSSTTEASQIYGQEQVNAISSRSGTEYPEPTMPEVNKVPAKEKEKEKEKSKDVEKEKDIPDVEMSDPDVITSSSEPVIKTVPKLVPEYPPPPYPQRLKQAHESKQLGKFLDVLKQLHINIPLLEALQQIPNYARFMKDVLTKKRRLREFETVEMTGECSMIMQNKIPMKLKDPGSFTIPCSIGKSYSSRALCDLGASINLMPKSIFKKLGIGTVRPTTVTLQLADRSTAYPEGIIENVLIKVDKFVFPVDFVVLDFNADKEVPIILGRPFLATAQTLIDVQKGELTMRVNDQEIKFNVMKTLKSPDAGTEECSFVMSLDSVTQNHFYKEGDHLVKALANTEKEKLVEEVVLQGEDDVNESSKESEGGKDGSEKEEIAMEIEPEPGPKTTLNQQKGPSPLTPPYKNPPPQSPPKQPIPLPLPPKITKCTQVIAEIKQPETTQISQQSKPKVKEDLVVASSATASDATDAITSTTQVNEGATVVDMFDEATGEAFKINGQGVRLYSGAHVERDKVIKELPKL